jgi:hypothetical protein
MKRTPLFLFLAALVVMLTTAAAGFGQAPPRTKLPSGYYTVVPLQGVTSNAALISAAAATTIPMWDYSVTSPVDGVQYSGMMVGRSPFFHGARTTDVPTILVPIKIVMPDGGVFDPTAADPGCSPSGTALALVQASPVLQPASFVLRGTNVGTTQYPDAFQRSNFWTNVSVTGDRYHTMLSPVTTLGAVTINVPRGSGTTNSANAVGGCGTIGVMDINWWDPFVQSTIIPSLAAQGVSPTALPLFLFYNVVMAQGSASLTGSTCCILGYHGAFGLPVQTYSPFDFDTTRLFGSSISAMSHEVAEWMDDPLGTNAAPAWGHIGQVTGCQNDVEVGDPLTGTLFPSVTMPNGVTYMPQELAFFSWFYRQSPSLGIMGWYSGNGTFATAAGPVCK